MFVTLLVACGRVGYEEVNLNDDASTSIDGASGMQDVANPTLDAGVEAGSGARWQVRVVLRDRNREVLRVQAAVALQDRNREARQVRVAVAQRVRRI